MNADDIRSIPFSTPDGSFVLQYTLFSDIPVPGVPGGTLYGIRISLYDASGKLLDSAERYSITADYDAVMRILDLLIRNTVSPCTLEDVLADLEPSVL